MRRYLSKSCSISGSSISTAGADNRPQYGAGAAEQHGEQKEHRAEELKIVGTDVILLMREQCPAESSECRTDDENDDLQAIDVDADGGDGYFAMLDRTHSRAEL